MAPSSKSLHTFKHAFPCTAGPQITSFHYSVDKKKIDPWRGHWQCGLWTSFPRLRGFSLATPVPPTPQSKHVRGRRVCTGHVWVAVCGWPCDGRASCREWFPRHPEPLGWAPATITLNWKRRVGKEWSCFYSSFLNVRRAHIYFNF